MTAASDTEEPGYAFHDSETLLASCRVAEDMGKVVSVMFFD